MFTVPNEVLHWDNHRVRGLKTHVMEKRSTHVETEGKKTIRDLRLYLAYTRHRITLYGRFGKLSLICGIIKYSISIIICVYIVYRLVLQVEGVLKNDKIHMCGHCGLG